MYFLIEYDNTLLHIKKSIQLKILVVYSSNNHMTRQSLIYLSYSRIQIQRDKQRYNINDLFDFWYKTVVIRIIYIVNFLQMYNIIFMQ